MAELPVPQAEVAAALDFLRGRYPNLPPADQDPLISLPMVAELAGVSQETPTMWVQRSRPDYKGQGRLRIPFPPPADTRYDDKPQRRAISQVLTWLWVTDRWPRGTAARPDTRGRRGRRNVPDERGQVAA